MHDDRLYRFLARDSVRASIIIVTGCILRLAGWSSLTPRNTETVNVAVALATSGRYADAFGPGSGPTAHLTPVMPLMIAGVYRLAGIGTPAAEFILGAISTGLIGLAMGLTYLVMRQLGMSPVARLTALALVALLPIQFAMEVRELRVWEGPLAAAGLAALMLMVLRLDRKASVRVAQCLVPVALTAVLALVSPAVALAGILMIGILALRRLPPVKLPALAVVTGAIMIAVLLPWALHNKASLGRMIWLRSNGGLELGVALNDTLSTAHDQRAAYVARLDAIHPMMPRGYAAMRAAGGELPYYDRIGSDARRWVTAHPVQAAELIVRHVGQYIAPPPWFFFPFGGWSPTAAIRGLYLALTMIIGLAGLPALIRRDSRYLYVAAALAAVMLPYFVVQPILRYRFLAYIPSVFLAVEVSAMVVTSTLAALRGGPYARSVNFRSG